MSETYPSQSAALPPVQPVAVTVTAPSIPTPVVDGYTQLVLTVMALLLAVVAGILLLQYFHNLKSLDDALIIGPNGPRFDAAPLAAAVRDELEKRTPASRFLPVNRIFLTASTGTNGKNGDDFIWSTADVDRWRNAGFVVVKDRVELDKVARLSAADRKRLSDAGVEAVAIVEPTSKSDGLACDQEHTRAFGWPCLEARLGDFDALRIVRTEWGKKGLDYYRLILATFEVEPTAEMQSLFKERTFWGVACAVILRHDPFRNSWKVVALEADNIDGNDLDTTDLLKLWSTMEH